MIQSFCNQYNSVFFGDQEKMNLLLSENQVLFVDMLEYLIAHYGNVEKVTTIRNHRIIARLPE